MTKEEIINSHQWKMTVKLLKKEFPYILKVDVEIDKTIRYSLVNLIIYIDPFVFIELYGGKINPYFFYFNDPTKKNDSLYLSTIFGLKYEEGSRITEEIFNVFKTVQSALPDELKFKNVTDKYPNHYVVDSFIIPANLPIPKDMENPPGTPNFYGPFDTKYFFRTTDEAFSRVNS